jgi:signal transduction histidine kinase
VKKEKKIWWNLALSYFLFALGSLVLAIVYLLISVTPTAIRQGDEMMRSRTEKLAEMLSRGIPGKSEKVDMESVLEIFSGPRDPQFWVFDTRGALLLQSPRARESGHIPPGNLIDEALKGESKSGILKPQRLYYRTMPVLKEGKIVGAVYLSLSLNAPTRSRYQALIPVLKAFALIALLALLMAAFMARAIVRPLEEMTVTARKLAGGDLTARIRKLDYSYEIRILGETMNIMAGKLSSSMELLVGEKEALVTMEQMRRDLLASVSHEIRTPLSTIQGSIEALQDGVVKGDDAARYMDNIRREVMHLDRLIADLLELSRLEAKAVTLSKEHFSVKELFLEVLRAREVEISRAVIKPQFDGDDCMIFGDRGRYRQVLLNLVENVLRYCPSGTEVSLHAHHEEERLVIIFEDTGPGIPAPDLPRVFDYFYRVEKSRTRSTGGCGLGLAIVRNLVLIHGGTIEAENREDHGLRIIIGMPKDDRQRKEE